MDCSKILVVDGKSKDRTVEIAKKEGATVIYQSGLGKGNAIACAIKNLDSNVDYVVITDADYTYPAQFVPKMIKILEQNPHVGMVCGNRLSWQTNGKTFYGAYYFGNKFLAFTYQILSRLALHDPLSGLRVIRSNILRQWQIQSNGFDIEIELNYHVKRQGFQIIEIPITYRPRLGEKKLKPLDAIIILRAMLFHFIMNLTTQNRYRSLAKAKKS